MEKLIVTVKELAPLLDTTPGVIYRMVKKGEIPYRKITMPASRWERFQGV